MRQQQRFLEIGSMRLKTLIVGEPDKNKPCIVLLHGGLDCLEMWKGYPADLAKGTGLPVVAYERFGHGESGCLTEIRKADYRHVESNEVLPAVMDELDLTDVILVGHSDGAAMTLMAAATQHERVLGVCAIAPPLIPEEGVRQGIIEAMKEYEEGGLAEKLKVFHGKATDALFYGWAKAWISEEFGEWSCEKELRNIRCPVHMIFGQTDDYGYQPSMKILIDNLVTDLELLVLKNIGHMPHHHARKVTIESVCRLIKRIK